MMKIRYDKKLKRWRDEQGRFVARKVVSKIYRRRAAKRKKAKPPEKPPEKPQMMWRYTVAINYVWQHKYYAVRGQTWVMSPEQITPKVIDALKEAVLQKVEQLTGYPRANWWFVWQIADGIQQVPYDPELIGKTEVEDETLMFVERRTAPRYLNVKGRYVKVWSRPAAEKEAIQRRVQKMLEDFANEV
jgi:hypothetical protein